MASRKLHNRCYSTVSLEDSDHSENMEDSNVNCSESNAEVTVRENAVAKQVEQNSNTVITSNDSITICTDSSMARNGMSSTQLQELLSTLLQTIQSENCKQTAALEAKLTLCGPVIFFSKFFTDH
jgi:hypothetical protein